MSFWSSFAPGLPLAPALAQHPGEALGARDLVGAGAVHGDVAVALEQAHQPADLVEHRPLLGLANSVARAAVVERVLALAELVEQPADGVEQLLRVGVDRVDGLAHQAEEVLAHPRDAGELGPVGDLVQRQPEPELPRREGEALLEGEDVRADVVHDVLVVGASSFDDQQVVLAEHPGRHPAEQHAHLGAGHPAGHGAA